MFTEGEAFFPLSLLPDLHGPHFHEAVRRLAMPSAGPFVVHLALTGACPFACRYCHAGAGGPGAPDLGDARIEDVARSLVAHGVPIVIVAGGEPLTRFSRLVRAVEILSRGCEVRLATSGIGLSPERAARLRAAGLSVLAVSLDSDDAASVDATRGRAGAFDAAVHGLRSSASSGLVTFVTSVVAPGSWATSGAIDRFLGFVRSIDPRAVVNFVPQFATGRASSSGFRDAAEYAPVARRIDAGIRLGRHRATVFLEPMELMMGCVGGGLRQVHLDIRGNVAACVSGVTFGNVVDEPFDAVWRRLTASERRLKRGFLCAAAPRSESGAALSPDRSARALADFHAAHPDTVIQRMLDVAGPALGWLAR